MNRKLYVFVRQDMSCAQRAVQAGHAVAEWCCQEACRWQWDGRDVKSLPSRWTNGTLVYLGVRDEAELQAVVESMQGRVVSWREPYWNNSLTAVAVLSDDPGEFYQYRLLEF